MKFEAGKLYHVYNQGNNRQRIFYSKENYRYFLRKMRKQLLPHSELFAYCLMPNHLHWLLQVQVDQPSPGGLNNLHPLTKNIAKLLSSYARAINNQEGRTGSLFRQRTKAIKIDSPGYAKRCFHYIHNNPVKARFVDRPGDWEFSSFRSYIGTATDDLINMKKACKLLRMDRKKIVEEANKC